MPIKEKNIVEKVVIDSELQKLLDEAEKVYLENFDKSCWLGRCIFLSWYCALADCDFCFRTTQKHKIQHPSTARRTYESVYTEAFLIKKLNWRLEFLTGGYGIFEFDQILHIAKTIFEIVGKKIWLNLGTMTQKQLEEIQPYVEGIVASVETLEPKLHKKTCPSKPIAPYERTLKAAKALGMKTSITIVLGLGESLEDYNYVKAFIEEFGLERITYYALRPVRGTPYEKGPEPEFVAKWIAKTRIDFSKIEIIVGTAETRIPEINIMLRAGANAITKIPATRIFGTKGAELIHEQVRLASRNFISELRRMPEVDWENEVSEVIKDEELKNKIVAKLKDYEHNRLNKSYKDFKKIKVLPKQNLKNLNVKKTKEEFCDSCDY